MDDDIQAAIAEMRSAQHMQHIFHAATVRFDWVAAEAYRLAAVAHFEAALDAHMRASRRLEKYIGQP